MTSKQKKKALLRDPFYEPPLHKAHYHPSKQTDLSKQKKLEGVFASDRFSSSDSDKTTKDKLSPADERFLRKGITFKDKFSLPTENGSPGDNSEKFDESWPVTERPSSLSLPGVSPTYVSAHPDKDDLDPIKSRLDFQHEDNKLSTLSKYIERFRKGPPMSREERDSFLDNSKKKDFWWLNESRAGPTDSSTPRSEGSRGQIRGRERSPGSPSESRIGPILTTRSKGHDERSPSPMSRNLAVKADRLLDKIESSYMSSEADGIVSTVGLGSTPSDSTYEVKEQPYRPSFTRINQSDTGLKLFLEKPSRPEDDILHQWRMRRKLEIARGKAVADRFGSIGSKVASNIDSPISAFRSRLAQGTRNEEVETVTSTRPRRGMTTVTIAENTPKIENVHKGLGKEIETQTENRKDISDPASPKYDKTIPVIIASPQLNRKSTYEEYSVPPHVHLQCDILPCCHGSKRHQEYGCHGNKCNCCSKKRSDEGHALQKPSPNTNGNNHFGETDLDEQPTKESSDFEMDSEYKKYKREHLIALHREIEESLNSDAYSVHSNESEHARKMDPKKETSKGRHKMDHIPEKDSERSARLMDDYDVPRNDQSQENGSRREHREHLVDRKTVKHKEHKGGQSTSKSDGADKEKLSRQRHCSDSTRSSLEVRSSSEFEDKALRTKELDAKKKTPRDKRGRSSDGRHSERSKDTASSMSLRSEEDISTSNKRDKGKKSDKSSKVTRPVPTRSDAQPQPSVGSAIGEVVNERLFLGASVSSTEEKVAAPTTEPHTVLPPTLKDLEDVISDDEAYGDDEMLQELRKKRNFYVEKLKEVELLLSSQ